MSISQNGAEPLLKRQMDAQQSGHVAEFEHETNAMFRFVLQIPGIEAFCVKSLKAMNECDWLVEMHAGTLGGLAIGFSPSSLSGDVKLLGRLGDVTHAWSVRFSSFEFLPFDLDYSDSKNVTVRILLKNVKLTPKNN